MTFERLVPAASVGAPGLPGASVVKDWKIDGVQNWRELITNGATTTTSVDAVNQYTAFGAAAPDHDLNGNLLTPDVGGAPAVALEYDFLNRLRRVTSAGGGSIEHDYDAEGRRVRTRASAVASMPAVSEFVFDGWEEIEEHVKATSGSPFALARRYVHGRNLDEPVRLENLAFYPGPGTYWFQQSTLGNVAAIADSSGAIVERYTYDAYGLPQFETPANVAKAVAESEFGNPYLFHARRFEPGVYPLYDFRARFLDPTRGRFVQRDPPGVWHDPLNLGGAQAFGGLRVPNATDPSGRTVVITSPLVDSQGMPRDKPSDWTNDEWARAQDWMASFVNYVGQMCEKSTDFASMWHALSASPHTFTFEYLPSRLNIAHGGANWGTFRDDGRHFREGGSAEDVSKNGQGGTVRIDQDGAAAGKPTIDNPRTGETKAVEVIAHEVGHAARANSGARMDATFAQEERAAEKIADKVVDQYKTPRTGT